MENSECGSVGDAWESIFTKVSLFTQIIYGQISNINHQIRETTTGSLIDII